MNKGIIVGFRGSWSSGIAQLMIKDTKGHIKAIPCENTATVRALDACYGGVIRSGRTACEEPFVGKKIFYEYDDMGLMLGGFAPVCDSCGKHPAVDVFEDRYICKQCLENGNS